MTSSMKTSLVGGLIGLTLLGATASTPALAGHDGGAVAAGVIGGLAAGAIAGSALSNGNRGYYDGGYAAPAYAAPGYGAPVYGGGCYFVRKPVYDDDGEMIGHRRVRVCE